MTTIHWFRKGLRLHDNPALQAAVVDVSWYHVTCFYIYLLPTWIQQDILMEFEIGYSICKIVWHQSKHKICCVIHVIFVQNFELRPVFVLDPWFVANARVGKNRWRFLSQTLTDLDATLKAVGSRWGQLAISVLWILLFSWRLIKCWIRYPVSLIFLV